VATGGRVLVGATCVVLVAVGAMLALIGAFLIPLRLFGHVEGLAVVIAVAGNLAVGLLAAYGTGTPYAATASTGGWLVVAAYLTFHSHNGGVVIPGKLGADPGVVVVGTLWLLGGVIAGGTAMVLSSMRSRSRPPALHQAGERAEA
jgi:hypothetical protein